MPPVSTPLRIALVSLHTSPDAEPGSADAGGMNVVVLHQAEALAALGHTVDILTRRSSAEMPGDRPLAERITLRFLDAGPARPVAKGDHESFIDEFRMRLAALGPYDLIHSHHWFSGMAALPVARRSGIPHVQSFHSIAADESTPLSEGERPESAGRMAGESWLARESDAVVAISEAEADTVVHRLRGVRERIAIVPPGVDGELFRPAATGRGKADDGAVLLGTACIEIAGSPAGDGAAAPADGGYVVVAGRLQPLKGFDLAIDAIAAVPPEIRPEILIAGDVSADFGGYIAELRSVAALHGIEGGVRFVGGQSRTGLAALLRGARVVLIPSHSETYGLVALEAAASGVPVIAASSGGLREAVLDGVTGLVLDSRDPIVWAEAVTRLLSDSAYASRLSLAARERAERLDWAHSAEALASVYYGLMAAYTADGWLEASGA